MLLDHEERFDRIENQMVTKKDHGEVLNRLDKIIGFWKKVDQEMTFQQHAISRHERAIKKNRDDIDRLSSAIQLS